MRWNKWKILWSFFSVFHYSAYYCLDVHKILSNIVLKQDMLRRSDRKIILYILQTWRRIWMVFTFIIYMMIQFRHYVVTPCAPTWMKTVSYGANNVIIWWIITIAITNRYALPGSNAPLCSIELFENTKYNVTITEFTGLLLLYRVFAALSFSCFVMFLTICMKKVLPALSGVILLTLSPMLLSSLGVEYVDRIDYTRFLRGTPLFVNGSEWVFLIIIYGLLLIAGLHAYREWCNQKG